MSDEMSLSERAKAALRAVVSGPTTEIIISGAAAINTEIREYQEPEIVERQVARDERGLEELKVETGKDVEAAQKSVAGIATTEQKLEGIRTQLSSAESDLDIAKMDSQELINAGNLLAGSTADKERALAATGDRAKEVAIEGFPEIDAWINNLDPDGPNFKAELDSLLEEQINLRDQNFSRLKDGQRDDIQGVEKRLARIAEEQEQIETGLPTEGDKRKIEALSAAKQAHADANASQIIPGLAGESLASESNRKKAARAQQCFLLYNNHFFVQKHRDMLSGEYRPNSATTAPNTTTGEGGKFLRSAYKTVPGNQAGYPLTNTSPGYYSESTNQTTTIMVYDGDELNDSTILNRIKSKKKQDIFDQITPAEYAQLIPSLRLYKIFYDDETGALGGSQGMIEFKFSTKIDPTDIAIVNKTFERNIRGDGVGVESFEWSYLGTDPFTATRDLKATLKLKFQSFHELEKPRFAKIGADDFEYRYLDLIVQPNCAKEEDEENGLPIYDPGCYEVVAEVGYATPSTKIFSNLTDDKKTALLEAVESTRERLYLVMTNHSFDFGQDGTFDITIDYRARLGSQMGSRKLNVLLPGGGNAKNDATTQINELKEKLAKQKEIEKETSGTDPTTPDPGEKSESKKTQEQIDILTENTREDFYNALYSSLQNRGWIHGVVATTEDLIKFLNYDKVDLRKGPVYNLPDPLGSDTPLVHTDTPFSEIYSASGRIVGATAKGGITTGTAKAGSTTEATSKAKEDQLAQLQVFLEASDHLFHFVYFGDIIATVRDWVLAEDMYADYKIGSKHGRTGWKAVDEAAIKFEAKHDLGPEHQDIKQTGEELAGTLKGQQLDRLRQNFKLILGNVQLKNWETDKIRLVNLAHIPVSLPAFLNFMTRKVVAQKRSVYTFSSFINDLLREVVMVNLNTACFGGLSAGKVRTTAAMFTIPARQDIGGQYDPVASASDFWKEGEPMTGQYAQFHPENIKGGENFNTTTPTTSGAAIATSAYDYLLINTLTTNPKLYGVYDKEAFNKRNPSPTIDTTDDKSRGIPHYTFGMDRGLLKTVKFAKTDQEFLPEARYEQEGSSAINQLAAVYDVTFEMLGTARFQPGQYIYFNPITIGVGQPWERTAGTRSWANLMGLGGYHLVVEVACSIRRGEYNTTLKTRWTTSGCHPVDGCMRGNK